MKSRLLSVLVAGLSLVIYNCKEGTPDPLESISNLTVSVQDSIVTSPQGNFIAQRVTTEVIIDGDDSELIWSKSPWYSMNYNWIGIPTDTTDYHGKFKLAWDENYLYLLAAITDDYLQPTLKDGLENYWKGDYVEIFIDENRSGGDHKWNSTAFAYHVSTEGHAIDLDHNGTPIYLDDHIQVKRVSEGNQHLWELAIPFYPENNDSIQSTLPRKLLAEEVIGFSIAYGDNDGHETRENFVGSKESHGINNDEGYTNADVFGSVKLGQ